jgi:hypothetical protein
MKGHWRGEIQLHAFLTSTLDGGEWSGSRPGHFTPREIAAGTHWIGGWVGIRASLDGRSGKEKNSQPMPVLEPPDHAAHSPALYHWTIPTLHIKESIEQRSHLSSFLSNWKFYSSNLVINFEGRSTKLLVEFNLVQYHSSINNPYDILSSN